MALKCPITTSILGALPATIIVLSTYIILISKRFAYGIWILGIISSILYSAFFTFQFIGKVKIIQIHASYFIPYMGMAVAAMTSSYFEMESIGRILLVFDVILLIPLAIVILKRYTCYPKVDEQYRALVCILNSPLNICMAGYIQTTKHMSKTVLYVYIFFAVMIYVGCLINAFICLKLSFYPSIAALTFPFVISAIALKQAKAFAKFIQFSFLLSGIIYTEVLIAIFFIGYVCIQYGMNIFRFQSHLIQPSRERFH